MENNQSSKDTNSLKKPLYFESPVNKKLIIKWEDGKKILNTKNTNYSYGMLEEVLNYGLDLIPLDQIKSILLLGMGAGCVIKSLREKYNNYSPIKAIELDPVVIELAARKFSITPSEVLKIIQKDANSFIYKTDKTFDLIIVDIFVDLIVPPEFYEPSFWNEVTERLNLNGFILFNAGIDLTEEEIDDFLEELPDNLVYQVSYNVFESNTVIILHKFV